MRLLPIRAKGIVRVDDPEFDSTNGEPCPQCDPNERLFDNPDSSLESKGEIDIPQMTSADSDSDSSSDSYEV